MKELWERFIKSAKPSQRPKDFASHPVDETYTRAYVVALLSSAQLLIHSAYRISEMQKKKTPKFDAFEEGLKIIQKSMENQDVQQPEDKSNIWLCVCAVLNCGLCHR